MEHGHGHTGELNQGMVSKDVGAQYIDPWIHRSKGMSCATCMWFVKKVKTLGRIELNQDQSPPNELGRCRRHAPTVNGYPAVFTNDWCGDHKPDENKI